MHFKGLDQKRHILYLGGTSARGADELKRLVEGIPEAADVGAKLSATLAKRLDDLSDDVHAKMASVGLVNPRAKREAVITSTCPTFQWGRVVGTRKTFPTLTAQKQTTQLQWRDLGYRPPICVRRSSNCDVVRSSGDRLSSGRSRFRLPWLLESHVP